MGEHTESVSFDAMPGADLMVGAIYRSGDPGMCPMIRSPGLSVVATAEESATKGRSIPSGPSSWSCTRR